MLSVDPVNLGLTLYHHHRIGKIVKTSLHGYKDITAYSEVNLSLRDTMLVLSIGRLTKGLPFSELIIVAIIMVIIEITNIQGR